MTDRNENASVSLVTISSELAERRLDNFLLGHLKGLPRSRIYRMIRSGEVRVNKRRAKPGYRLNPGDRVRVPPVFGLDKGFRPAPKPSRTTWIKDRIIYEDADLLVIDKPSGLAVHGGSGISYGAIELLRAAFPQARSLELAHRLDRDTSGCLLVAKRRSTLRELHQMFREGGIDKTYVALLAGQWAAGRRLVDQPLHTEHRKGGERHVRVDESGKPARTRFVPEQIFAQATLARVELLTGRTHQIRVHAAHVGHPVLGDQRYGPGDESIAQRIGLERLFLHAAKLSFPKPGDGIRLVVESPLDTQLNDVLDRLEQPPAG